MLSVKKNNQFSISIVIPVYNSQDCIEALLTQIIKNLDNLGIIFEIIFVDDKSIDKSWAILKKCFAEHKVNMSLIKLSKNYGQDSAIMSGLKHTKNDFVVIMDDDLQHNPKYIDKLIEKVIKSKSDVCYANFEKKEQTLLKNIGSWINDKLANVVIKKPKKIYLSPFKIISKKIIKAILQYDGPYPYIDGLIFRYTNNITQIEIPHQKRYKGKGNYNLIKSISVWLRVLTNFSILPLRLTTSLGLLSAFIGFTLAIYFIFLTINGDITAKGWPSLIVTILFLGGIQLIGLGLIGEYVGRSYLYQNKEPQFLVDEILINDNKVIDTD